MPPLLSALVALTLALPAAQKGADKPSVADAKKRVDAAVDAYFAADALTRAGRDARKKALAELESVPLAPAAADAQLEAVLKRWTKGRELDKKSGQAFFWEKEKRGLFIVGGETRKPKALAICMHGGGAGEGEASSAQAGYEDALRGLGWLAIYPEVLEKTEHGWTDAGTEEFVLALLESARRTWKIDPERVFLCGHSMGGYGSWTLGAHHADELAAIAPSAGAPTPIIDRAGKVLDISEGIIANLRNLPIRIYQSDDDPRVPPDVNRCAARRLQEAKERWGGFDFEYWEVPGRQHEPPPGGYEAQLAKIEKLRRDTHPDTVVWQPTLDWVWQSYWLYWQEPLPNALIVAKADRKTNTVRVTCDKDAHGLYVLVDEHLLDPQKEITVFLNEKQIFKGLAQPSMATILATGARGDPELACTSRIPLF